jgi:hypothetical protein
MTATGSRQGDTSRAGYLADIAALLWPEPAVVTVGGAARGASPAVGDEEYIVVPNARHPRLVVPRHRRAAAAAVAGFNAGRSRRALLLSGPLNAVLRSGAGGVLLRDLLLVSGADDTLRSHLSEILGQQLMISVQLGPARANRKPVAQLIDFHGTIVGYAKIGVNDLTRRLIRHEAAALGSFIGARPSAVTVPGVLHLGHWRDTDILVLEPLPAWDRAPARSAASLLSAAMTEIAGIAGIVHGPLAASQYWRELRAGLDLLGERGTPFGRLLGRLGERQGGTVLAFGSWHGDWTRSNVAPHGGTVLAWDWERFRTGVPVGFDALHYHLQTAISGRRRPPESAVRDTIAAAERLRAPFGVADNSPAQVPAGRTGTLTAALYLAELALRYLQDRQDEAGAWLGHPERWLLPGLAEAIGELT